MKPKDKERVFQIKKILLCRNTGGVWAGMWIGLQIWCGSHYKDSIRKNKTIGTYLKKEINYKDKLVSLILNFWNKLLFQDKF